MSIVFIIIATLIFAIGVTISDDRIVMGSVPVTLIGIFWLLHERLPRQDNNGH